MWLLDRRNRGANRLGGIGDQGNAGDAGIQVMGKRAFDESFQRGGDVGDQHYLGHRERAIHRVNGTQQRIGHRLRAARSAIGKPCIHNFQVSGDFGLEDFQQNRVDGEHRVRVLVARGRFFRVLGNPFRLRLQLGSKLVTRCVDCRRKFRFLRERCGVADFFADSQLLGGRLDAFEVGMDLLALQGGAQQRQAFQHQLHQRQHLRTRRTTTVEHTVEQAFNLPAEIAERLGADQATTALQGVEHAADGTQQFRIGRFLAPGRQQLRQVVDFFL